MTSLVKDLSDGARLTQFVVRPAFLGYILTHTAGYHGYVLLVSSTIGGPNAQPVLGDVSLGRYNKNSRMCAQKAENVNRALEFINSRGVKAHEYWTARSTSHRKIHFAAFTLIPDITDGNLKLILGMICTLVLRFTIADICCACTLEPKGAQAISC